MYLFGNFRSSCSPEESLGCRKQSGDGRPCFPIAQHSCRNAQWRDELPYVVQSHYPTCDFPKGEVGAETKRPPPRNRPKTKGRPTPTTCSAQRKRSQHILPRTQTRQPYLADFLFSFPHLRKQTRTQIRLAPKTTHTKWWYIGPHEHRRLTAMYAR